jgi:hypothetical protein
VKNTNIGLILEYKEHFEVNLHYRTSQCPIYSKHSVFRQNNLLQTYTNTSKQTVVTSLLFGRQVTVNMYTALCYLDAGFTGCRSCPHLSIFPQKTHENHYIIITYLLVTGFNNAI